MPHEQDHPFLGQAARDAGAAGRHGLGLGRGHARGPADEAFASTGDHAGTARWARAHGWTSVADGEPGADLAAALLGTAPLRRLGPEHAPRHGQAGHHGDVPALAFDVALRTPAGWVPEYAVTALALGGEVPAVRLTPARLWSQGGGGWQPLDSGDRGFDARWRVLATPGDAGRLAPLAADPALLTALLSTDDGDDLWTATGCVAALRPDGHRPSLLDHHLGLLTVVRQALARLPR